MATDTRTFPDISFVDTDTDTTVNRIIQKLELRLNRTLYPADPMRLLALWLADVVVQLLVNIDFSAKQNLPRFAEDAYLDSLMEIFKDVFRLDPETAKTTLMFTLSTAPQTATTIKKGTRATPDGQIMFATTSDLVIPPGEQVGYVVAECLTAGEIGNDFVPGQISQIVDSFPLFDSVENVTKSEGGAEVESDAALYSRSRESFKTYSTAGTMGAYEYYAKSASALIVDAKAQSPTPGVVDVRVLLQDGKLPEDELLREVETTLSASLVRPLTDFVEVAAPDPVSYDIDCTYYIQENGAVTPAAIEEAVEAAVNEYITWQSERMGRDINPSRLNFLLMQTGIKRVDIRSPVFTEVPDNAVAVVSEAAAINGGYEDE